MLKETWVLATKPNQVPNHNQISMKWRNRENHKGKTLLQKEIAIKEGRKDSSLRLPRTTSFTPSIERSWRYCRNAKGLVKMSATCSVVGMYSKLRKPSWIRCLMKCMWSSMCFVRWSSTGLREMCIALWLSHQRKVGLSGENPNSIINYRSHKTSWLASTISLYSASIDDNAWACCFLQDQVIGPDPR